MERKAFKPCGIITLTTDTANKGSFVATIKGVILRRFHEAKIVDLTHDLVVQWPAEAGFWLSHAYRYFPAGTVHLCVVDPGARLEPHALVAVCDGHAFLGPDNGVLAPLLAGDTAVYAIDLKRLGRIGLEFTVGTFHGRDLYAPIAAALASGACRPETLGEPTTDITPSWVDDPDVTADGIRGVVITVDNFGNLITNIEGTLLAGLAHPVVFAGGHEIPFRTTYSDATPGDYLALVNSFNVLEVAQSEMSAEQSLGIGRGAPVVVRDLKTSG
jgi:hypothetical protein